MASPENRKTASSKHDTLTEDGNSLLEGGPQKKASSKNNSLDDGGNSCFLEAEPSKAFTDSTVRASTSRGGTPQSSGRRKVSIRKLSVEATLDIPLNDDCNELIEEKEKSIAEHEKSMNKSSNKAEEEPDISIVKTMTTEQIQEHVSRCLQLSTENKINTKNAFALKLIDCMTIITRNDEKSNFAVMACQLDAGAKIYSSRVDAVHQQVMKLVETCMFAEKKERDKATGDDADDEDEGETGKEKERKKKPRKKVIATNDQISRQPKENDPKDMFLKLEALPGDILNKARYTPDDLSLTLDKHLPFWIDWHKYKPTRPEGENLIPEIDIKNRKLRPKLDLDSEIDLSSIPKLEPLLSTKFDAGAEDNEDVGADNSDNSNLDQQNIDFESFTEDEKQAEENQDGGDIEVITVAKLRMASEGSKKPSTQEVIKTLFHNPGESDYHYLKMDSSNFWAGPSYWKRPQGHNLAENKKKAIRKKKEPVEVLYTEKEANKGIGTKDLAVGTSNKKASTLSKRTMSQWNKKKVTYPQDIHFEPEAFYTLFITKVIAEVDLRNLEDSDKEKPNDDKESHDFEDDNDSFRNNETCSPDMFEQPDGLSGSGASSGFKGFPSPGSSNVDSQNGFKGFPSPNGSSPFDPEHGFRGFDSQGQSSDPSNPSSADTDGEGPNSGSCDVYEGENLVPMVKTVKVDPIRIVAKPNRVDMQHLKGVMLNIIRRAIEDRENKLKAEGLTSPRGSIAFREVLTQLLNNDQLHHRTREDLTVQMAFLCLLTLTNENSFLLKKDESEDFLIMYDPREPTSGVGY